MRVLLTGGGTAGHINPALAIAETVLRNAPGSVVEFVGVAGGKEDELVPRAGYKHPARLDSNCSKAHSSRKRAPVNFGSVRDAPVHLSKPRGEVH